MSSIICEPLLESRVYYKTHWNREKSGIALSPSINRMDLIWLCHDSCAFAPLRQESRYWCLTRHGIVSRALRA